ncbi:DUF664 domain-containing protein [Actinopolyspora halophila]|uniref:mycothiol transferase n=1 Tax=Actinopolyspora halophila TaxID=1850 RepID=UPI00036BC1D4|nr:DUF664 domain-containing protein [Actinopolyspora halophila]
MEPTDPLGSRSEVFVAYLDFFRETLIAEFERLPPEEVRSSRLPSGWSPLELLEHLRRVERRWLEWGFLGIDLADPWAEFRRGRWHVPTETPAREVVAGLRAQGVRSSDTIRGHDLDERARPGPRWEDGEPATLERVLFHLVQEYARHVGQLDVVTELITGVTGE